MKRQLYLQLLIGILSALPLLSSTSFAHAADLPNEIFQLVANDGTSLAKGVAVSNSEAGAVAVALGGLWGNSNVSGIYVFRWNSSSWIQEQKLTTSDGGAINPGGIAVDGNVAVAVSAVATYIFRKSGSSWTEEQRLPIGNGGAYEAVSISGNVIVVGNYTDDFQKGAVYVYRYHPELSTGARWIQEQRLVSPDSSAGLGLSFGFSAAVLGNRIVVGAPGHSVTGYSAGSAYIFEANGSNWSSNQTIVASDGAAYQGFGSSVALDGNSIVVGATGVTTGGSNKWIGPAAYVFRQNGTNWVEEAKLPSDGFRHFAVDVAATQDSAVVSSNHAQRSYIFRKNGANWTQTATQPFSLSFSNTVPLDNTPPLSYVSASASNGMIALSFDSFPLSGTYLMPVSIEESHPIMLYTNGGEIYLSSLAAGRITPPGSSTVAHGRNKTFGITPNPGYYIQNLIVDDLLLGPISTYTFTNVTAEHQLNIAFGKTSDTTPPTLGTPSYGPDPANTGSGPLSRIVTIRSVSSDNVGISKVEFYAGTSANPYSILIGTDHSYRFSVEWDTTAVPNGSYVITTKAYDTAPTPNTAIAQRTVTVSNGNFVLTNGGNKVLLQGSSLNQTITASVIPGSPPPSISFSVSDLPQGVTRSFPTTCTPNCSTSITLTASTDATPGTFAVSVTGIAGSNFSSTTFNLTITKPVGDNTQYTLTTGANITRLPAVANQVAYTAGTLVTLTANTPNAMTFSGWSGCITGTQNPITITMDAHKTCIANFTEILHTITANAGIGGSISPFGTTVNMHGTNRSFNIQVTTNNYRIADVLVDGVSVGPVNQYTFSNVTTNHTISAIFAAYDFSLTNGGDRLILIGQSVTNTITTTTTQGTPPSLTFFSSGFTGNITSSFNPPSCTPSCSTTLTMTANNNASPGTYQISVNTLGRATYFTLTIANQIPTTEISESSPPHGYVDSKEDRDAATGLLLGTTDVSITFSAPITKTSGAALSPTNFERTYFRNGEILSAAEADVARNGIAPTVSLVSGTGRGPYLLRFTPRIPLGAWTEIKVTGVKDPNGNPLSPDGNRIVLGALPMDITQDGKILGDDINLWNTLNDSADVPLQLLDQKRNGVISGEDISRGMQLINGIGTFQAWRDFDMGEPPQ